MTSRDCMYRIDLAIQQLAPAIEHGKGRHTLFYGNLIMIGNLDVLVEQTHIDVDDHEMRIKDRLVNRVMEVRVQHMAVRTPVAA